MPPLSGDRTRHLPPCTGTVPQAHRHLASHGTVVTNPKPWREQISRLFYKGIDQMFLFSRKLIRDSQKTRKAPSHKLKLIHLERTFLSTTICWQKCPTGSPKDLSPPAKRTGTWTPCSSHSPQPTRNWICTLPSHAATSTIKDTRPLFSARLHSYSLHRRSDSLRTGKTGSPQSCIVICCLDFPYTVGLTTS